MNKRCLLVAAVGLLLAAAPQDEAIKKDRDGLQGTWSVITVISDGKEIPADKLVGAKVIIKGDMLTGQVIRLGKGNECSFKIDPTKKVKTIDFIHADGAITPGVYSLNENKLKICNAPPKVDRPKALDAPKGSSLTLINLHRDR